MTAMGFLAICGGAAWAAEPGGWCSGCSTVQSATSPSPTVARVASSEAVCRSADVSAAPAAVTGACVPEQPKAKAHCSMAQIWDG
jgi:hypothetical protein